MDQPLVESQVERRRRARLAQAAPRRLGQQVREDEAADACQRLGCDPRRGAAAACAISAARSRRNASSTRVSLRGMSVPVSARSTVMRVAVAQEGEMDRAWRAHPPSANPDSSGAVRAASPDRQDQSAARRSSRNAVATPGHDTS